MSNTRAITDIVELAHAWVNNFAEGNFEQFPGEVAPDFILRLPFLPEGIPNEYRGRETVQAVLAGSAVRRSKLVFSDVVILKTEDPELVVITAKAQATLDDGSLYKNEYIMLTRIRGNTVLQHTEYLNPLAVPQKMAEQ